MTHSHIVKFDEDHVLHELKHYLQAYPENDYIRGLVYQYVQKRPEKKLVLQ